MLSPAVDQWAYPAVGSSLYPEVEGLPYSEAS